MKIKATTIPVYGPPKTVDPLRQTRTEYSRTLPKGGNKDPEDFRWNGSERRTANMDEAFE